MKPSPPSKRRRDGSGRSWPIQTTATSSLNGLSASKNGSMPSASRPPPRRTRRRYDETRQGSRNRLQLSCAAHVVSALGITHCTACPIVQRDVWQHQSHHPSHRGG